MGWTLFWALWIAAALFIEFLAVTNEVHRDTLSSYMRDRFLRSSIGSATVGAFLVWLIWHWLFVDTIDLTDLIAMALGAAIGLMGHRFREEALEEFHKEE